MANGTKQWYEELKDWIVANRERQYEVLQQYSQPTLLRICNGEKLLENIPLGKRLRFYELTRISAFAVEGLHPQELDIDKIQRGEQPRNLILRRVEYDNITQDAFADKLGVSRTTFRRYLSGGETVNETHIQSIESGVRAYLEGRVKSPAPTQQKRTPETTMQLAPPVKTMPSLEHYQTTLASLLALQKSIAGAYSDVLRTLSPQVAAELLQKELEAPNKPTLEHRIAAVVTALDVLADQVEYFKSDSTPDAERQLLAKNLDVDTLGFVVKILPRINQRKSYETVDRLMPRPQRGKQ